MATYYSILIKTGPDEKVWSLQSTAFREKETKLLRDASRLSPAEKTELDNFLYDNLMTPCFGKQGDFTWFSPLCLAFSEAIWKKPSQVLWLGEDIKDIARLKEQLGSEKTIPQIVYLQLQGSVTPYDFTPPTAPFSYEGKYLLNHDKKLAYRLEAKEDADYLPAVLTRLAADEKIDPAVKQASGNGAWALDLISIDDTLPEDFTLCEESPAAYSDIPAYLQETTEDPAVPSPFTTRTRTHSIVMRDLKGRLRLWSMQDEEYRRLLQEVRAGEAKSIEEPDNDDLLSRVSVARDLASAHENSLYMNHHAYYGSLLTDAVSRALYHNPSVLFWKENSLKNIWLLRKGLNERYGIMSLPYIEKTEPKEGDTSSSTLASRGIYPFDEAWFRTLDEDSIPLSIRAYTRRREELPTNIRIPHVLYPFLDCFLGWRQDPAFLYDYPYQEKPFNYSGKYLINYDRRIGFRMDIRKNGTVPYPLALLSLSSIYTVGRDANSSFSNMSNWTFDTISIEDALPTDFREIAPPAFFIPDLGPDERKDMPYLDEYKKYVREGGQDRYPVWEEREKGPAEKAAPQEPVAEPDPLREPAEAKHTSGVTPLGRVTLPAEEKPAAPAPKRAEPEVSPVQRRMELLEFKQSYFKYLDAGGRDSFLNYAAKEQGFSGGAAPDRDAMLQSLWRELDEGGKDEVLAAARKVLRDKKLLESVTRLLGGK